MSSLENVDGVWEGAVSIDSGGDATIILPTANTFLDKDIQLKISVEDSSVSYTAGDGITISDNTISVTKYTLGPTTKTGTISTMASGTLYRPTSFSVPAGQTWVVTFAISGTAGSATGTGVRAGVAISTSTSADFTAANHATMVRTPVSQNFSVSTTRIIQNSGTSAQTYQCQAYQNSGSLSSVPWSLEYIRIS